MKGSLGINVTGGSIVFIWFQYDGGSIHPG